MSDDFHTSAVDSREPHMTMDRLALESQKQLVYYLHGVGEHVLGCVGEP